LRLKPTRAEDGKKGKYENAENVKNQQEQLRSLSVMIVLDHESIRRPPQKTKGDTSENRENCGANVVQWISMTDTSSEDQASNNNEPQYKNTKVVVRCLV
jgi:hypothetical protein